MCTGVASRSSIAQQGRMRMLVPMLAIGYYLQGEEWLDSVECVVIEHTFAIFRLLFSFIVSLRHVWLFGVHPRYGMTCTYTLSLPGNAPSALATLPSSQRINLFDMDDR